MDSTWECVVVGGGAAGLSAGLVLGRARRRALIVDAGSPSNLPAHGIGGLLGHDGRPPADLYARGRDELAAYPTVEVRQGEVVAGEATDDGFTLRLADGGHLATRRVLLATGMDYRRPDLPGLAELWGTTVFHCPFCHGWEVRDRPLAVLDPGPTGVHRAQLLRGWSDDVVLLTDGPATLEDADRARLRTAGVTIDERPVTGLVSNDGALSAIEFAEGPPAAREGLLVAATLHQRSPLASTLGVTTAPPSPVVADGVAVDGMHRTNVPGVFAAGDLGSAMPQIASAISAGSMAAAAVVGDLLVGGLG
ncbi:MAG: NAD(P)/FAD-dependent oxidoreductase [Solirubrobacteraceae bacterium]